MAIWTSQKFRKNLSFSSNEKLYFKTLNLNITAMEALIFKAICFKMNLSKQISNANYCLVTLRPAVSLHTLTGGILKI